MEIYILRHSDAEDIGRKRDADRSLTERGIKKMKKIAAALKEMELTFDAILTSPYNRAKETAEIVGEIFECSSQIRMTPNLVSEANPSMLVNEINEDYQKKKKILLVGHEPFLSEFISVLISGRRDVLIKLRKGGVCKMTAEHLHFGRCATLEWLMASGQFQD